MIRFVFKSRWIALLWAAGICYEAMSFADHRKVGIDAANSADTHAAQNSALAAEDPD